MRRILLIDDDELLAPPLAECLRRFDLQLDSATRPGEGLERLRSGGHDAVILDVMLPEMDGFELCRTNADDEDARLLLATAAAYAFVRHRFRPLDDFRAGAQRFGQAAFDVPIPVRRQDECGDLAAQPRSTRWRRTSGRCSRPSGACCWRGATSW